MSGPCNCQVFIAPWAEAAHWSSDDEAHRDSRKSKTYRPSSSTVAVQGVHLPGVGVGGVRRHTLLNKPDPSTNFVQRFPNHPGWWSERLPPFGQSDSQPTPKKSCLSFAPSGTFQKAQGHSTVMDRTIRTCDTSRTRILFSGAILVLERSPTLSP